MARKRTAAPPTPELRDGIPEGPTLQDSAQDTNAKPFQAIDDKPIPDGARAFSCPSCGKAYYAVPDAGVPPGSTLRFDLRCVASDCDYKAAMGIG